MFAIAKPDRVHHPRRPHALALSVALHGALLAAWMYVPMPPLHQLDAGQLTIQMVMEAPPEPPPPAPQPPPEPPPPQPKPQPQPQPQPQPAPVKPLPKAPAPVAKPAPPPAATSPAASEPAQETAAAPAEPAQPVMTSPPAPAAEGASAGAVPLGSPSARKANNDEYMGIVWSRIMRYRPARVTTTGTTRLRFTLDAGGELVTLEVAESSGSAMLDRAAVDAVRRAAPFPPPPAAAAPVHHFEIPFQFRPV